MMTLRRLLFPEEIGIMVNPSASLALSIQYQFQHPEECAPSRIDKLVLKSYSPPDSYWRNQCVGLKR
jgi:hypothetical protein